MWFHCINARLCTVHASSIESKNLNLVVPLLLRRSGSWIADCIHPPTNSGGSKESVDRFFFSRTAQRRILMRGLHHATCINVSVLAEGKMRDPSLPVCDVVVRLQGWGGSRAVPLKASND